MRAITLLILLLVGTGLYAQGVPLVETLYARGGKLATERKWDEANSLLLEAAQIARLHNAPRWQARCLIRLGELHGDFDWPNGRADHETGMFELAAELAMQAGDRELEVMALSAFWATRMNEFPLSLFDALLVQGMSLRLEQTCWTARMMAIEEAVRTSIDGGLGLLDARARAALQAGAGRKAEALATLEKAAEAAAGLKLHRMQASLLLDALALKPALAPVVRALLLARGALVDAAALDVATVPASPEGEDKALWLTRLQDALELATRASDFGLQQSAALALRRLTGDARWARVAENARLHARYELLAEAERALADDGLANAGLKQRLQAYTGDADCDRAIVNLGWAEAPAATADLARSYTEALEGALADDKTETLALLLADIARRPEGAGPLLKRLASGRVSERYLVCLEGLPTAEHVPALTALLDHKDANVRATAAAELFRINPDGLEDRAAKFAGDKENPSARFWMLGWLARHGDAVALTELESDHKDDGARAEAAVVLSHLGYGSTFITLTRMYEDKKPPAARTLNRLPTTMGATLAYTEAGRSPMVTARMLARRGIKNRHGATSSKAVDVASYSVPRNAEEGRGSTTDDLRRLEDYAALGPEYQAFSRWLASHAGMTLPDVEGGIKPPENEPPLQRLARIERDTAPQPALGRARTLVLVDTDDMGRARCRITARFDTGEIVDGVLIVPFQWTHSVAWESGGFLGQMYRNLIGQISLAGLFKSAELLIPDWDIIKGETGFTMGGEKCLRFVLPKKSGEGLVDDIPVELETLLKGTVLVGFSFMDNPGNISFPLKVFQPTKAEKPDLVAEALLIDPPMPEYGRPARLLLVTRNLGATVRTEGLANVKLEAQNPQGPDGWRALYSFVFPAWGWRAGETRVFESRPLLVNGYFMNTWSYTYNPLAGDSQIRGTVDSSQMIAEDNEDNNSVTVELPLELPENLAKPLADEEAAKALEKPFADLLAATSLDDLQKAYAQAAAIIIPLENHSPLMALMGKHLTARHKMKTAHLKAAQLTEEVKKWRASGQFTVEKAKQVRDSMLEFEAELIESGVPVEANALEKARNATLLAASVGGGMDDLAKMRQISGLKPDAEGPASLRALKALDAAALVMIEADRLMREGKADAGNLLDAASNAAEALNLNIPGLSNFHRELFKAEVEYATKGFEKSTDTLNILSELIEKGESKDRMDRLAESVGEVEKHMTAGPFNEKTLGNVLTAWAKDLPLVGRVVDFLTSKK